MGYALSNVELFYCTCLISFMDLVAVHWVWTLCMDSLLMFEAAMELVQRCEASLESLAIFGGLPPSFNVDSLAKNACHWDISSLVTLGTPHE